MELDSSFLSLLFNAPENWQLRCLLFGMQKIQWVPCVLNYAESKNGPSIAYARGIFQTPGISAYVVPVETIKCGEKGR